MVVLGIVIIIGIVLALILYVTDLPFEMGTGFTENKRNARKGDYTVVENNKTNNSEETNLLL